MVNEKKLEKKKFVIFDNFSVRVLVSRVEIFFKMLGDVIDSSSATSRSHESPRRGGGGCVLRRIEQSQIKFFLFIKEK